METLEKALPFIAAALALASIVLHALAPKTKNTVDDKLVEVVDAVKDQLPKAPPKP